MILLSMVIGPKRPNPKKLNQMGEEEGEIKRNDIRWDPEFSCA